MKKWLASILALMLAVSAVPACAQSFAFTWTGENDAQYSVLLESRSQRDSVQKTLKEQGIPTMVYYPRGVHQQTAYASRHWPDAYFPNTIEATNRILSLPMHPYLTDADIETVTSALQKALRN